MTSKKAPQNKAASQLRRGAMHKEALRTVRLAQSAQKKSSRFPLRHDAGTVIKAASEQLRALKKLPAKNRGDIDSALMSAGHYAQKRGKLAFVYANPQGGGLIYQVSFKASDYLNPINNGGRQLFSVSPDLEIRRYKLTGGFKDASASQQSRG